MRYLVFKIWDYDNCDSNGFPKKGYAISANPYPIAQFEHLQDCEEFTKDREDLFSVDTEERKLVKNVNLVIRRDYFNNT